MIKKQQFSLNYGKTININNRSYKLLKVNINPAKKQHKDQVLEDMVKEFQKSQIFIDPIFVRNPIKYSLTLKVDMNKISEEEYNHI